ncbi:(2Fe-2S)-binding protein [Oleispirillum naphthae]|uniref:(2Fe-2S)-binding protein n=1 Tax=Oleispirillum naphthae TaxID=2838853 RepID=UPI0030824041
MIVCHCHYLTDRDIARAVDALSAETPQRRITPSLVYAKLGRSGGCGGCYPLAHRLIARHLAARTAERSAPQALPAE